MRCNICNKILEPNHIKQDKRGEWMPCAACVAAAWVDVNLEGNLVLSDEDAEFYMSDMDAVGMVGNADD